MAGSRAGLAGDSVFATLMIAAPAIEEAWVAAAREVSAAHGIAGVTRLPGLLLARYRGDSGEAARHYCMAIWQSLRAPVLGRDAVEPRIWRT